MPLVETARVLAWRADNGWLRSMVGAFEGDRLIGFVASLTSQGPPDTSWVSVRFSRSASAKGSAPCLSEQRNGSVRTAQVDSLPAPTAVLLREQVGVLKGMVDAEAPNGTLQWQATPVSAVEYGDEIGLWQQHGRTAVESVTLDSDGVVVACTCLVTAADTHRPAQIEGTLVLTAHRGRRLGAAVKTAGLLGAHAHGGTARVRAISDDQNVWMRAINEQLGFLPVESEVVLRKQRRHPITS